MPDEVKEYYLKQDGSAQIDLSIEQLTKCTSQQFYKELAKDQSGKYENYIFSYEFIVGPKDSETIEFYQKWAADGDTTSKERAKNILESHYSKGWFGGIDYSLFACFGGSWEGASYSFQNQ